MSCLIEIDDKKEEHQSNADQNKVKGVKEVIKDDS